MVDAPKPEFNCPGMDIVIPVLSDAVNFEVILHIPPDET